MTSLPKAETGESGRGTEHLLSEHLLSARCLLITQSSKYPFGGSLLFPLRNGDTEVREIVGFAQSHAAAKRGSQRYANGQ
jgi:hypothetical protein